MAEAGGKIPSFVQNPMTPEFYKQIASGNLSAFVKETLADELAQMISTAHGVKMLSTINGNIAAIEEKHRNEQAAIASTVVGGPTHDKGNDEFMSRRNR